MRYLASELARAFSKVDGSFGSLTVNVGNFFLRPQNV